MDLNLMDGKSHVVALYLLDWENAGRSERVEILDANSDVLYTSTVSSFNNGTWLVWDLAGHVQIRVTSLAGPNAVTSGIFFGSPGAPQLAAPGQGADGQSVPPLTDQSLA